jgi:hypothetical protein
MTQSIEVFAIFCSILVVIFVVSYYRSPLGPDRVERKRRSDHARRLRRGSPDARAGHAGADGTRAGLPAIDGEAGPPPACIETLTEGPRLPSQSLTPGSGGREDHLT